MPRYDFTSQRLYVEADLAAGRTVALNRDQAHYLGTVLRMEAGAHVLAFNGRDGEWRARLDRPSRHAAGLVLEAQTRPQPAAGDLHYLFAPLKRSRLDYMVQKAIELGVTRLQPVLTRHTQAERVKLDRMRANAIEAAEQCGVLTIADVGEPVSLDRAVAGLGPQRVLVFCDEDAPVADPLAALAAVRTASAAVPPLAVLIGPEGGFSEDERKLLLARPNIVRLALGPRILRADTAAVAALSLTQAVLGDWRG